MAAIETNLPYPAQSRHAAGEVNGVLTEVTSIAFNDKILVTITQYGRLAQWISVPLISNNPIQADTYTLPGSSNEDSLLPSARFTPYTLLGAGGNDREVMGQLYASQIASAIATKAPGETRSLVLGLGLVKVETDRQVFLQIMDLVLTCI